MFLGGLTEIKNSKIKAQYSIKEVETLSGVKAHTLRIWEQRYHLLTPERTDTNIRFYSDEQLRMLLNIATLNRNGMKISKIAGLEKGALNQEVLKVFESANQPDNLLDSLIHSMLDFDIKNGVHNLTLTELSKLSVFAAKSR